MLNDFFVRHLQQPAHELSDAERLTKCRLILNLGKPFNAEQWYDGCYRRNQMEMGDFTFLPVGMSRRVIWDRPIECLLIELDPVYVNEMMRGLSDHRYQIQLNPHYKCHDSLIHQLGLALRTEIQSRGTESSLYVESVMATLTVQLLRQHTTWTPMPQGALTAFSQGQLRTVTDYIHSHLDRTLSLNELASIAQMSKYHLIRLFKKSTDTTLHSYVTTCRIEAAKRLLAQRNAPLVDICHAVGFQSQSHFTQVFHRYVGVPPKAYQDSL